MHNAHQFVRVRFALHTVAHERVDHEDFSLEKKRFAIRGSVFLLTPLEGGKAFPGPGCAELNIVAQKTRAARARGPGHRRSL